MFSKGKSYWSARRANMAKADIYIADMLYDVADFEGETFVDSGTTDPSLYLPVNSSPEINEPGELHGVGLLIIIIIIIIIRFVKRQNVKRLPWR